MKRTYTFLFFGMIIMSVMISYVSFHQQSLGEAIPQGKASRNDGENRIPLEAIRLRVIANSDSTEDQWLKRKVRDEVVAEMKKWALKPRHIQEAREMIQSRMPLFEQIAKQTLHTYGVHDTVDVTFGKVPFPTKLYGDQVYPAGKYEALRITIGKGKGENWWCVLFPPLCFIDMSSGEAIPKKEDNADALSAAIASDQVYQSTVSKPIKKKKGPEIKFYLLDRLSALWND